MKLIIAGSRDRYVEPEFIDRCLLDNGIDIYNITHVISGGATGIDDCGESWAENRPDPIRVLRFPANWMLYGRAAGPIRNREMATQADLALIIMKTSLSKGSENMIKQMEKLNKPVIVVLI